MPSLLQIEKLLALAEKSPYPEERAASRSKAESILKRCGFRKEDIISFDRQWKRDLYDHVCSRIPGETGYLLARHLIEMFQDTGGDAAFMDGAYSALNEIYRICHNIEDDDPGEGYEESMYEDEQEDESSGDAEEDYDEEEGTGEDEEERDEGEYGDEEYDEEGEGNEEEYGDEEYDEEEEGDEDEEEINDEPSETAKFIAASWRAYRAVSLAAGAYLAEKHAPDLNIPAENLVRAAHNAGWSEGLHNLGCCSLYLIPVKEPWKQALFAAGGVRHCALSHRRYLNNAEFLLTAERPDELPDAYADGLFLIDAAEEGMKACKKEIKGQPSSGFTEYYRRMFAEGLLTVMKQDSRYPLYIKRLRKHLRKDGKYWVWENDCISDLRDAETDGRLANYFNWEENPLCRSRLQHRNTFDFDAELVRNRAVHDGVEAWLALDAGQTLHPQLPAGTAAVSRKKRRDDRTTNHNH